MRKIDAEQAHRLQLRVQFYRFGHGLDAKVARATRSVGAVFAAGAEELSQAAERQIVRFGTQPHPGIVKL